VRLAREVKDERGSKCECCGATSKEIKIVTDHIKPIKYNWHLRLDKKNMQVLCNRCNRQKGSWDVTDFGTSELAVNFSVVTRPFCWRAKMSSEMTRLRLSFDGSKHPPSRLCALALTFSRGAPQNLGASAPHAIVRDARAAPQAAKAHHSGCPLHCDEL
jgi:hypothetical protein